MAKQILKPENNSVAANRVINKPFNYTLPKKVVEAVEALKEGKHKCRKLYAIQHVFKQQWYRDKQYKNNDGYVSVDSKHLKYMFGSQYRRHLNMLVKHGILLKDNYIPGVKATGYKLNPDLECEEYVIVELTREEDDQLYDNFARTLKNRKTHYYRQPEHLKVMRNYIIDEMTFDVEGSIKWVQENTTSEDKQAHYLNSILKLSDRRERYAHQNKTNQRLDTNITNLKTELRVFVDPGMDKAHIDLKNSQPYLLSTLIVGIAKNLPFLVGRVSTKEREYLKLIPICLGFTAWDMSIMFGVQHFRRAVNLLKNRDIKDLEKFRKAATEGKLYEQFAELLGDDTTRDEAKDIYFKVLFSRNRGSDNSVPYHLQKNKFAAIYPTVSAVIRVLKNRRHASLAIMLQRMESQLFIGEISKTLVEGGIVPITIHDSFLVPFEHGERTLEITKAAFKEQTGAVPTFSVEKIEKRS